MEAVLSTRRAIDQAKLRKMPNGVVLFVLVLASCLSLAIDIPCVNFFQSGQLPKFIEHGFEVCESFGDGFGATLIVIAVLVLDPTMTRYWPWMFASCLGSGMVANAVKLLVHRARPRDFDLVSGNVWATFAAGANNGMSMQSFPSAHTATAVGLAIILSTLYPRGKWFFTVMGALVGMQRVVVAAHFPSDVFAGAAVGWIVGSICANMVSQQQRLSGRPDDKNHAI